MFGRIFQYLFQFLPHRVYCVVFVFLHLPWNLKLKVQACCCCFNERSPARLLISTTTSPSVLIFRSQNSTMIIRKWSQIHLRSLLLRRPLCHSLRLPFVICQKYKCQPLECVFWWTFFDFLTLGVPSSLETTNAATGHAFLNFFTAETFERIFSWQKNNGFKNSLIMQFIGWSVHNNIYCSVSID